MRIAKFEGAVKEVWVDKARKRVDMVWEEMIEEWNWRGRCLRKGWQGEDDKVEGMMRGSGHGV